MRTLVRHQTLAKLIAVVCLLTLLLSTLQTRAVLAASTAQQNKRRRIGRQGSTRQRPVQRPVSLETNAPDNEEQPAASPPAAQAASVVQIQSYEKPTLELLGPTEAQVYYLPSEQGTIKVPVKVRVSKPGRWRLQSIKIYDAATNAQIFSFPVTDGIDYYTYEMSGLGEGLYKYRVEAIFKSVPSAAAAPSLTETANTPVFFLVRPARQAVQRDNGITVGQTKLFDERSITAKLEELEASLSGLGFVDRAALARAIGSLQGARQDVSALSLNVTGLPTPGIIDKATGSTVDKTTSSGTETTTSSGTEATTTTSSVTPTAPALPNQTPALSSQLSFGTSAQDLLAEQVQLTYQIINLRTLLERAITDRVSANIGQTRQRRPAVIGFQISLDSRKQYRDALAEVDVRITSLIPAANRVRPSLISLIPKEKTYNVATITKNARQFGFGAVVQVLNIGASVSRSRDTFFLVRDTDTVATERRWPFALDEHGNIKEGVEEPGSITFGWQFRPVLGRKAVEPGSRAVFALLSLPPSEAETYIAKVEVFTRWRKYDSKAGTVGDFIKGSDSSQVLDELIVPPDIDEALRPVGANVRWEDTNDGQALVVVNGKNFLPGTGILVGNTLLDRPQVGFVLSDEKSLRFTVPIVSLASLSDLQMVGRFGSPFPLRSDIKQTDDVGWGIQVEGDVHLAPIDAENTQVSLKLAAKVCPAGGTPPCFPDYALGVRPLVMIGKSVFGHGDSPISLSVPSDKKTLNLTFKAPTKLLGETGSLKVKYPFFDPEAFTAEAPFDVKASFGLKSALVLSSDDSSVQIAIRGAEFKRDKVTVRVGKKKFKEGDAGFEWLSKELIHLNLDVAPKDLTHVKNIIVEQEGRNLILPFAMEPQPSPKPEVIKEDAVVVGDSKTITLKGANFSSIQEIRFEGRVLAFEVKDDGATLLLSVPSEMTVLPGSKELNFSLKDGKSVTYTLKVLAR